LGHQSEGELIKKDQREDDGYRPDCSFVLHCKTDLPRLRWGRGAGGKAVKAIGGDYRDYSVG
ncbi:MAG: hypothetical protein IKX40_09235, partial [Thermoguttaceae bacterium]|nr:hypothetical protein [Thermoguttaceae bacterium]